MFVSLFCASAPHIHDVIQRRIANLQHCPSTTIRLGIILLPHFI